MSGQWEVVGKSKLKHSGQPVKKLSKSERKKFVEKAPKVEDILPLSQVKTLYNALELNKENKKAPGKENSSKESESKKVQKKLPEKKKETAKEKPPPPKSLECAVKLLNTKEMAEELLIGQARFQNAPLIWLRGLAIYLNTKMTVDHNNPTFSGKPVDYPLCLLPGEVKELLKRALRDAGESVDRPFFDWCLTSMANGMTKASGSVLGYKMILQLMAFQNPRIVVANIPNVTALLNSYQNRQPIGLSLLWALGLGGYKDLSVGITVWQVVMVPVIELRNYSSYVIGYIKDILSYKPSTKPLSPEQFFAVLDVIFSPKLNLPTNLQRQELGEICSLLKNRILEVEPDKGFCNLFQSLLERLELAAPGALQKELLTCLMTCLNKDPRSYSIWRQLYMKNLPQSALLLGHLDTLWKAGSQPVSLKHLKETLITFQVTNEELAKCKHKEEGLEDCKKFCTELNKKMTVTRSFPWKLGSFILLVAIGCVLAYEVTVHGSFKRSCVGLFLRDIGALHYAEHAWTKMKFFSEEMFGICYENGAYYYAIVAQHGKPYFRILEDVSSTVWNHMTYFLERIKERIPTVVEWINFYAPGLLENLNLYAATAVENSKHLCYAVSEMVLQYSAATLLWMKTNTFVGSFCMENVQKCVLDLLSTTQEYGKWTYDWICQKVQTLSKMN
ncbi:transmembrane protein 214-B [Anabrus simplex]|uniref:transmembrane protein 214-B n=1 Tax=Anabrus simplex TaxID=316456 RepID=UPI0034DDB637